MSRVFASSLCLILAICIPGILQAEAFEFRDEGWEGTSEFLAVARAELGPDRVLVRADLDWSQMQAGDAVLLLHPERSVRTETLAAFLRAGGRVGILDDFGAGERTLSRFGIHKVPAPTRPADMLRNNPELAIAVPVPVNLNLGSAGVHPVVAGLDRLVTNHPSALKSSELTPILKIRAKDGEDAVFGLAGELQSQRGATATKSGGKLIAVGDPSVLINEMIRYPGNRAFAVGLVRYLARQEEGGRGKLYLLANDFGEHGSLGGGADVRSELETELETLRREMGALWGDGLSGPVGLALGAVLTLAFVGFCWNAHSGSRTVPSPRFTAPVPLVAQGGMAGRAAVLAATSTPKALVLIELRTALEETLAYRAGVSLVNHPPTNGPPTNGPPTVRPSTQSLLQEAAKDGTVDGPTSLALKGVLAHMSKAETLLVTGRGDLVRSSVVAEAARTVAKAVGAAPPPAPPKEGPPSEGPPPDESDANALQATRV